MAAPSLAERWDALAEALRGYRDVLEARVLDGSCPEALVRRGWAAPLLALSDDELITLEIEGAEAQAPARLPSSLVALFALARELTQLPLLCAEEPPARRLRRLETPRKRTQVQTLAELARPLLVEARRVVEVGAGHGHLAREVAAQIERPVVGLERDPALSRKAQQLESFDRLSFVEGDALLGELPLGPGDCALGLHACGELGDALVEGVAAKADALLLVGCCLQKRRAPARAPLNAGRPSSSEMVVSKELLGLSNFTPRSEGVEASRAENVAARERRLALHALLTERVGPLRFGAEMDGLNRRAAHGSLDAMARRAFTLRGLELPSPEVVRRAELDARQLHDRIRRLAVPRVALARVLEVFVHIDRALFLETAGFDTRVGLAFPREISARNLALVARRAQGRAMLGGRAASR